VPLPNHLDRIESAPNVMMGKPVVAGTRITVESVLEKLEAGESVEDVLNAHPHMERADVQAALAYALAVLRMEAIKLVSRFE